MGIKEELEKLRRDDQVVPFLLDIERVYAPQLGPKSVYQRDPEVSVIIGKQTAISEGPEKTDTRSVRTRSSKKSTEKGVQFHTFDRNNGNIVIPFGGPRGLLMTALGQAVRAVKDMGYLAPTLQFMRVEPWKIEFPVPSHIPVDFVPEPRGKMNYSKGKRESMVEIAYEYFTDLSQESRSHKMEFYNSSIAKLSSPEWALVFHALETINGPPLGRGRYGISLA